MKLPFVLMFTLSGCATGLSVDYARLSPPRERPVRDAASVAVLFREPSCTFEELGILEVNPGVYRTSLQQQIDTLRSEAGRRGANGILMIAHNDTSNGDHSRNGITRHSYTALAIELSECAPFPVAGRPAPTPSAGPAEPAGSSTARVAVTK